MRIGYFAITYLDGQKDYEVLFGNEIARSQVVLSSNMKIHILPDNLSGVTLIEVDMVTFERTMVEYYSAKRGLTTGFLQEILVDNIKIGDVESNDGTTN